MQDSLPFYFLFINKYISSLYFAACCRIVLQEMTWKIKEMKKRLWLLRTIYGFKIQENCDLGALFIAFSFGSIGISSISKPVYEV